MQKTRQSMTGDNFHKQFFDKVQFQWKTLKKAFSDFNMGKTGAIVQEELRYYLRHWGFKTDEDTFQSLFRLLDVDGDGKISYEDFQNSVGNEISPPEFLYFRQDNAKNQYCKCQNASCFEPIEGATDYCSLHNKVNQDAAMQIFKTYKSQLGSSWSAFQDCLKKHADSEHHIFVDEFK